ncbi:MAG: hypothetical protein WC599_09950 [Bacteroidales bacterium]
MQEYEEFIKKYKLKVMAKAGCIEESQPSAINGGVIIIHSTSKSNLAKKSQI